MKSAVKIPKIWLVFVLLFSSTNSKAQLFKLAEGPIVNIQSDSRSINFIDVNNDGWEDIYVSNGLSGGQKDLLYLNDGQGALVPVEDMDIVEASNPSDGASFVDFNNDGFIDAVISSWYGSEDLVYLNDGSGQLNYKDDSGVVSGSYAETVVFGDFNNDGWADLYITNSGGNKKNFLYENLKDGSFEWKQNHVLAQDTKLSRGAFVGDFNNDRKLDLFIANEDNASNDLYLNMGNGDYQKFNAGSIATSKRSSITASWADIDNDGDLDLFVGNAGYFSPQKNQIFINTGDAFEEVTEGLLVEKYNCTYGSSFGDYDNDGDLDLFVSNGYCNSGLANELYENDGTGVFQDVSELLVSNEEICSFGAAWGDVNNDGALDLMIANCKNNTGSNQPVNTLLVNEGNSNHWTKILLEGQQSNSNGIGARVRIKTKINGEEIWQIREIQSQSGYAGQNSIYAHFGLGNATVIDSLVVLWPAGGTQILENLTTNSVITIQEPGPSQTKNLKGSSGFKLEIHPNFIDHLQDAKIQITNPKHNQDARLVLFDTFGQKIWTKALNLESGLNMISSFNNFESLPPGIYQLSLFIERERIITQFLKV